MKSFNPGFDAAMKANGARPLTLAVFHFATGDVFVSDRHAAPEGGPVFEGLVSSWGEISVPFTGPFEPRIPETALRIVNTGGTVFSSHIESGIPEQTEVELFQWFEGLTYAEKEPVGRFVISSPVRYDVDSVELALAGSMIKRNRVVGKTINREDYPGADPDAVGRTQSIVYGSVEGLACHGVSSGAATTLSVDIDSSQTNGIDLSLSQDETPMPDSGTLQLGREKISYTGISGKTLTGVTRGVSGTTASSHKKGETLFEVRQSYEYLVAGHPVKSIGDVYVGGVRVTSGVTRNTDASGKATLTFSDKFTVEKSVNLGVDEGSHSHADEVYYGYGLWMSATRWQCQTNPYWTSNQHVGKAFKDNNGHYFFIKSNGQYYLDVVSIHGQSLGTGAYYGSIIRTQVEPLYQDTLSAYLNAPLSGPATALCDGNWNSYCTIQVSSGYIRTTRSAVVSDKGVIVGAKLCGTYGNSAEATGTGCKSAFYGGPFSGQFITGGGSSVQTVRTANSLTKGSACTWSNFAGTTLNATYTGSTSGSYWEHWVEVYYIPYGGGASPATGVALTGDSAADIVVGGKVTCDVDGYADDGLGTYTGTPGALIQNPADVVRHFMANHLEVPLDEFDASFDDARTALAGMIAGGYAFAGVLDRPLDGLDVIAAMSAQSRMVVSHDGFTARALVLDGAPVSPDRVITGSMARAGSLTVSRTGREEVINRLSVHYMADLSRAGSSRPVFLEVADSSASYPSSGDTASVSVYGPRSPRREFMFGFVRGSSMASDLRDFYISRYKDAARRITLTLLMDNLDLEPGDVVELDWSSAGILLAGSLFEIEKAGFRPGGLPGCRPDEVVVQAREV